MKELQVEVSGLKIVVSAAKEELVEKENAWIAEKAGLVAKLDKVGAQLARYQAKALKSFDEGYGECCAHFVGIGIDVKKHAFECDLVNLQGKVDNGRTGSSNHPGQGGA